MEHALVIRGLVKRYGKVEAVRGVDLEVGKGEVFGLLGNNGAGKTSVVECAVGLRRIDGGTIEVMGMDVGKEGEKVREVVGVQLQAGGGGGLQAGITARMALRLFGGFYRERSGVEELLEKFDLKGDVAVEKLSGGQRQRLALAVAVVNDRPAVVFLDEPTVGLDVRARRELHGVIRDMREGGRTVFLTTHYIEEAEQLCDRIAVISGGRIVAVGKVAELIAKSKARPVVVVETEKALEKQVVEGLAGVVRAEWREGKWRLGTDHVTGTIAAVVKEVEKRGGGGGELRELEIVRVSLEDVYVELTGEKTSE